MSWVARSQYEALARSTLPGSCCLAAGGKKILGCEIDFGASKKKKIVTPLGVSIPLIFVRINNGRVGKNKKESRCIVYSVFPLSISGYHFYFWVCWRAEVFAWETSLVFGCAEYLTNASFVRITSSIPSWLIGRVVPSGLNLSVADVSWVELVFMNAETFTLVIFSMALNGVCYSFNCLRQPRLIHTTTLILRLLMIQGTGLQAGLVSMGRQLTKNRISLSTSLESIALGLHLRTETMNHR